jgi:hypothetical protein
MSRPAYFMSRPAYFMPRPVYLCPDRHMWVRGRLQHSPGWHITSLGRHIQFMAGIRVTRPTFCQIRPLLAGIRNFWAQSGQYRLGRAPPIQLGCSAPPVPRLGRRCPIPAGPVFPRRGVFPPRPVRPVVGPQLGRGLPGAASLACPGRLWAKSPGGSAWFCFSWAK